MDRETEGRPEQDNSTLDPQQRLREMGSRAEQELGQIRESGDDMRRQILAVQEAALQDLHAKAQETLAAEEEHTARRLELLRELREAAGRGDLQRMTEIRELLTGD